MMKRRLDTPICGRGEPHARRRVHGLRHVVDERAQLVVEHLDVFAGLAKALVWVAENGPNHVQTT